MQGDEVYAVLERIGAERLHHANTVTTCCTFLEQGGLASRGFVEDRHLSQTAQLASDEIDKRYGIWHDVFLDHVDIHYRAGRVKGPNHYGPVLFMLNLDILLRLPTGSDVRVTKTNPVHWFNGQPEGDRWFQSPEELAANLAFGNFEKMLVIRTPSTMIPFPDKRAQIALDDPKKNVSCGEDAYSSASKRLMTAATAGNVKVVIAPHECRNDCTCVEKYACYAPAGMDLWFT